LFFSFLCYFLIEIAIVDENNGFVSAITFVIALENSLQIFELLVLNFLQEEAEEIVLKVFLLYINSVPGFLGHLFVGSLRIMDQLSNNQSILITTQVVIEF
jgi:hypothetical protein